MTRTLDGMPADPPQRPSPARIAIWIAVAAVALWLIGTGLVGIISKG